MTSTNTKDMEEPSKNESPSPEALEPTKAHGAASDAVATAPDPVTTAPSNTASMNFLLAAPFMSTSAAVNSQFADELTDFRQARQMCFQECHQAMREVFECLIQQLKWAYVVYRVVLDHFRKQRVDIFEVLLAQAVWLNLQVKRRLEEPLKEYVGAAQRSMLAQTRLASLLNAFALMTSADKDNSCLAFSSVANQDYKRQLSWMTANNFPLGQSGSTAVQHKLREILLNASRACMQHACSRNMTKLINPRGGIVSQCHQNRAKVMRSCFTTQNYWLPSFYRAVEVAETLCDSHTLREVETGMQTVAAATHDLNTLLLEPPGENSSDQTFIPIDLAERPVLKFSDDQSIAAMRLTRGAYFLGRTVVSAASLVGPKAMFNTPDRSDNARRITVSIMTLPCVRGMAAAFTNKDDEGAEAALLEYTLASSYESAAGGLYELPQIMPAGFISANASSGALVGAWRLWKNSNIDEGVKRLKKLHKAVNSQSIANVMLDQGSRAARTVDVEFSTLLTAALVDIRENRSLTDNPFLTTLLDLRLKSVLNVATRSTVEDLLEAKSRAQLSARKAMEKRGTHVQVLRSLHNNASYEEGLKRVENQVQEQQLMSASSRQRLAAVLRGDDSPGSAALSFLKSKMTQSLADGWHALIGTEGLKQALTDGYKQEDPAPSELRGPLLELATELGKYIQIYTEQVLTNDTIAGIDTTYTKLSKDQQEQVALAIKETIQETVDFAASSSSSTGVLHAIPNLVREALFTLRWQKRSTSYTQIEQPVQEVLVTVYKGILLSVPELDQNDVRDFPGIVIQLRQLVEKHSQDVQKAIAKKSSIDFSDLMAAVVSYLKDICVVATMARSVQALVEKCNQTNTGTRETLQRSVNVHRTQLFNLSAKVVYNLQHAREFQRANTWATLQTSINAAAIDDSKQAKESGSVVATLHNGVSTVLQAVGLDDGDVEKSLHKVIDSAEKHKEVLGGVALGAAVLAAPVVARKGATFIYDFLIGNGTDKEDATEAAEFIAALSEKRKSKTRAPASRAASDVSGRAASRHSGAASAQSANNSGNMHVHYHMPDMTGTSPMFNPMHSMMQAQMMNPMMQAQMMNPMHMMNPYMMNPMMQMQAMANMAKEAKEGKSKKKAKEESDGGWFSNMAKFATGKIGELTGGGDGGDGGDDEGGGGGGGMGGMGDMAMQAMQMSGLGDSVAKMFGGGGAEGGEGGAAPPPSPPPSPAPRQAARAAPAPAARAARRYV